jgi:hypothetical protein
MAKAASSQYTIRGVPASVDRALRRRARERGKSLNAVLVEAVTRAAGVDTEPATYDDLDHLIGSWISDPDTERALAEQRRIEPGDWP